MVVETDNPDLYWGLLQYSGVAGLVAILFIAFLPETMGGGSGPGAATMGVGFASISVFIYRLFREHLTSWGRALEDMEEIAVLGAVLLATYTHPFLVGFVFVTAIGQYLRIR